MRHGALSLTEIFGTVNVDRATVLVTIPIVVRDSVARPSRRNATGVAVVQPRDLTDRVVKGGVPRIGGPWLQVQQDTTPCYKFFAGGASF